MGKYLSIALALALCACSDNGGGSGGTGTVSGPIGGETFPVATAISGTGSDSGSTYAAIVMSSAGDVCDQVSTENLHPNETIFELQVFGSFDASTGATTAPTSAGTFPIYDLNSQAEPPASFAIVIAEDTGSDCSGGSGGGDGMSGTVTLTAANAATGIYTGSYDVTFDTGDHVTGTFSPAACAAFSETGSATGSGTCE